MMTVSRTRRLLQFVLLAVCLTGLLLCPHSKVEESFGIQASHDLFYYGILPAFQKNEPLPYDHVQFPGVVPRTFMAPLIFSSIVSIIQLICSPVFDLRENPLLVQFLVRLVQLFMMFAGWCHLARALDRKTNMSLTGNYLLFITTCQFHLTFYASRMLPNCWALALCLFSFASWIQGNVPTAAVLLVLATAIFRCDLLILLFTVGVVWLLQRKLGPLQAIRIGVTTGMIALLVTVPLDSLLWRRLVWPEGEVLYFNTILNKSSDWGVSAWHWYWTSALPKSLLFACCLIPFSFLRIPEYMVAFLVHKRRQPEAGSLLDTTWLPFIVPAVGFVALYSALGHKEVRFLFPVLPLFNVAAAAGMTRLHKTAFPSKQKQASLVAKVFFIGACVGLSVSLFANFMFIAVSYRNYPGGDALGLLAKQFSHSVNDQTHCRVYIDVASAMTGVSLFGQRHLEEIAARKGMQCVFSKGGYEAEHSMQESDWQKFTYILSENEEIEGFERLGAAQGWPRLNARKLTISSKDTIFVYRRKNKQTSK